MAVKTLQALAETAHPALQLSVSPPVYLMTFRGRWLLEHATPSWRITDPQKGFQRIVNEQRAKAIARTVVDRDRAFPNAITLATDMKDFKRAGSDVLLHDGVKFLVVDGQHRLWAQKFSSKDGFYACVVHLNKTEKEMAELFLEINENQRRVPSSLRWDLVRLVRPDGDEAAIMATDLVYELAYRDDSPFHVKLDLTGEQKDISIKQGSLAPELKTLVSRTKRVSDQGFENYATLLIRFFSAVRSLDPQRWGDISSAFYKARVLRALIRVLTDLVVEKGSVASLSAPELLIKLKKIDPDTLSTERIRAAQGSAGVTDLYKSIKQQVFA